MRTSSQNIKNSDKNSSQKPCGSLYLIPVGLGSENINDILPKGNYDKIKGLDEFIVENVRTARRFLRTAGFNKSFDEITFHILNKHTPDEEIPGFLKNAEMGKNIGLLSEAGVPCIADPGQVVVKYAHEKGIRVKPLVGPSSILLALMASGFNGQNFVFHGYLPIETKHRIQKIREIEQDIYRKEQTQIFMETPYRNNALIEDLINTCKPDTMLCIASNITCNNEIIMTRNVLDWKNQLPNLDKQPTVFLLYK
ncbi:MAG: SAM-dependent methyltransferase [Bacteroidetes bacterium]|nr:MAG: SAM-dependent methyltransferase [Bacteroidota bacterium]